METFTEIFNLPKLTQEEIEKLNSLMLLKELKYKFRFYLKSKNKSQTILLVTNMQEVDYPIYYPHAFKE